MGFSVEPPRSHPYSVTPKDKLLGLDEPYLRSKIRLMVEHLYKFNI